MGIKLRIIHGEEERFHEMRDHESVVVLGRHASCDVVLDDEKQASRKHCQIERQSEGGFLLRDLDSSNGTKRNKEAVAGAVPLEPGDKIRIGETTIYFGKPPVPAVAKGGAAAASGSASTSSAEIEREARRAEEMLKRGGGSKLPLGLAAAAAVLFVAGIAALLVNNNLEESAGNGGEQTVAEGEREADGASSLGEQGEPELHRPDFEAIHREQRMREQALERAAQIEAASDASLVERVEQFDALLLEYRDASVYPVLADRQAAFMQSLGRMLDRRAERLVERTNTPRRNFRFAQAAYMLLEARNELEAAAAELDEVADRVDSRWEAILTEALQRVNDQAREIFVHQVDPRGIELIHESQELLAQGDIEAASERISQAQAHYREARDEYFYSPTFEITSVLRRIDDQLHDLEDLRDVVERGDADRLAEIARDMSDRHAEERDGGPTEGLGDVAPARKADPLEEREPELLAQIHERLLLAINEENDFWFSERRQQFQGRNVYIDEADEAELTLLVAGQAQGITVEWDDLQPEFILTLYRNMRPQDVEDIFAIAIYAFDHEINEVAQEVMHDLHVEDESQHEAIDLFLSRRLDVDIPEGGFVAFESRLMTPEEKEAILVAREVEELLGRLERLGSRSTRAQEMAKAAIEDLQKHDVEVRRMAVEKIMEMKEAEERRLEAFGIGSNAQLDALMEELIEARRHALELIFDEEAYPYPNPNNLGQSDVDQRVSEVQTIWQDPSAVVSDNIDPRVANMVDRIIFLIDLARELDPEHEIMSGDDEEEYLEWVRSLANQSLSIQNYGRNSAERNLHAQHIEVGIDNMYGQSEASNEERQHVRIVNAYRRMMGRGPVRINSDLTLASRVHSEYMRDSGQFAHNIPGHPYGASPGDRAERYGYTHPVGENIAMSGAGHTPESSFNAWYNSSGHHRNMLNEAWTVLGAGSVGTHWTQKFGAAYNGTEPYAEENHDPLPWISPPVGERMTPSGGGGTPNR